MRVAVSWLGEYVDIAGLSVSELDAALVRQGLEVEAVHPPAVSGPVVFGRVESIEELMEFRKPIRHCYVDVGQHNVDGEPRSIVCGASNFAEGDLVVVALPGSVLPGGFAIATRKTYGRVSDGMICAAGELGLPDNGDGIMVVDPASAIAGESAVSVLGLDETVIELAITPDRGYCLSMRGVAREVSHALQTRYRDPGLINTPVAGDDPAYPVQIAAPEACDRFVGRIVRGLDAAASTPAWMAQRLLHAGMRPISLLVDVTNYVMLELGQPLHAYDLGTVQGPIVVRRASDGERIVTLDNVERQLLASELVIADDSGAVGIAGVMGGASTEIGDATTDVLIEAAHFTPADIARAARRHKLPSEASKRFERGVDPQMTAVAAQRAVELLTELAGGTVEDRVTDVDSRPPLPTILLDTASPGRIAGVEYPPSAVAERLREIGCVVTENDHTLAVTPPSWRPDLTEPIDLVEEVIRLEGYDDIPAAQPPSSVSPGLTVTQRSHRAIVRTLAEHGFVQVLTFPFAAPNAADAFRLADDDPRRTMHLLANPLSDREPALRTWLLPGLLQALSRNVSRGQRDVALFETGLVFPVDVDAVDAPRLPVSRRPDDAELAELFGAVPDQPRHVAMVLAGNAQRSSWWGDARPADFSDAIAAAHLVAAAAGVEFMVHQSELAPWHPGRCARFSLTDGTLVGYAGELHPAVISELGLPPRTCAVELDLSALPQPAPVAMGSLSHYPPTLLDVAVVVDSGVAERRVRETLAGGAGDLLEAIELFDVFEGEQVGADRKSLAYALTFRAADRTLTVAEATSARDAAVAAAGAEFGAELRG